jgi:hypothetical protein
MGLRLTGGEEGGAGLACYKTSRIYAVRRSSGNWMPQKLRVG